MGLLTLFWICQKKLSLYYSCPASVIQEICIKILQEQTLAYFATAYFHPEAEL
jgi:hypothetical protein